MKTTQNQKKNNMSLLGTIGSLALGATGQVADFFTKRKNARRQAELSRYNTDQTIKAQKEMAKYAYDRDLEMWNRTNEFNNPKQQMSRLKSAGLNPNLVYGSGSVVGNTQSQMPQYQQVKPEYNYAPMQMPTGQLQNFTSLVQGMAQIDNIKANERRTEAQTLVELERKGLVNYQKAKAKADSIVAEKSTPARASTQALKNGLISQQHVMNRQMMTSNKYKNMILDYEAKLAKDGLNKSDNVILRQIISTYPNIIKELKGSIPNVVKAIKVGL